MKCPHCGLISVDSAMYCDCGYDFATGQMHRPLVVEKPEQQSRRGKNLLLDGAIITVVGILLIVGPAVAGTKIPTWAVAVVVFGVARFVRGWRLRRHLA